MRATKHSDDAKVVALRADVDTLRDDLEKLTSTLSALLSHQISRSRKTVESARAELDKRVHDGVEWIDDVVKEKPVKACAIAAGMGFIAALMMTKR